MKAILKHIITSAQSKKELLAVLIDPDKFNTKVVSQFIDKVNKSIVTHIFIGGSTVEKEAAQTLVVAIKKLTALPIVLFPGDVTQVSKDADALLFLSLLSGRNAEYLIGQHVKAVPLLRHTTLEIIPTGYILIDSGMETAVQRVTKTQPLKSKQDIIDTAKAGELLGMKLIYLEAGSGARNEVSTELIKAVKQDLSIPLLVGGGIKTSQQLENAYKAGADMVVIGTAFEENELFFNELKQNN